MRVESAGLELGLGGHISCFDTYTRDLIDYRYFLRLQINSSVTPVVPIINRKKNIHAIVLCKLTRFTLFN